MNVGDFVNIKFYESNKHLKKIIKCWWKYLSVPVEDLILNIYRNLKYSQFW